jgi:2-methylcitrate dehydratase PrpD
VLADGFDEDRLTGSLGERWEAALDTYKPYPCGIVLHPLIDGCLQVAAQSGAPAAAIERVEVKVHPLVMVLTGRTDPKDGLESKLSFTHALSPLDNPQSIRSLRRDIARLKTQLRKIQIGA